MGCLFKQEPSEGARWLLWKRGRNPTTRHRNMDGWMDGWMDGQRDGQTDRQIDRHPATIASLWSGGFLDFANSEGQKLFSTHVHFIL